MRIREKSAVSPSAMQEQSIVLRAALSCLFFVFVASGATFYRFEDLLGEASGLLFVLVTSLGAALYVWRATASIGKNYSPSWKVAGACFALAFVLCLLGGQGRVFYANADWQIRDAVYYDLAFHQWPFKYAVGNEMMVLRAPLGMYLFPALITKLFHGRFVDATLLLQSTLILGSLFCILVSLSRRKRQIGAIFIFAFFGGMQIVGYTMREVVRHRPLHPDHIENWSGSYQYSSFITDIFWAPQHGLAGMVAGLLFVLWFRRIISLPMFLAIVPLLANWSPFALIGVLPFALYPFVARRREDLRFWKGFAFPVLSGIFSLPVIAYLRAAPSGVRWSFGFLTQHQPVSLARLAPFFLVLFLLLQAVPFLVVVWMKRRRVLGLPLLMLLSVLLLIAPFIHLGPDFDFCMRATIPAMTILAVEVIESFDLMLSTSTMPQDRWLLAALSIVLCLGSVTGLFEIKRAVTHQPVKVEGCNLIEAWNQANYHLDSYGTYLAPEKAMPGVYRHPDAEVVTTGRRGPCWKGFWYAAF